MAPNLNFKKTMKALLSLSENVKKEYSLLSKDFINELKATHTDEQNPYGEKWKERKDKYSWPILYKTGKMFRGYKAQPRKDGSVITNTAPYSGFHQMGTKTLPVRLILPTAKKGMPESWKLVIQKKLNKALKKRLER